MHRLSRPLARGSVVLAGATAAGVMRRDVQQQQPAHCAGSRDRSSPPTSFDPNEWRSFEIENIFPLSHNTRLFRLKLPSPSHVMGIDVSSTIMVQGGEVEGAKSRTIRPYTPTTGPETKGFFDLIVKKYPEGSMSTYLFKLDIGDKIKVMGPFPKLTYTPNMVKRVGMIAGGTGITPMLQVLEAALPLKDDDTEFSLVYANISPEDILLKDRLDDLADRYHNFKVYYVVEKTEQTPWDEGVGYVNSDMIDRKLPPPEPGTLIMVCGPPGMMRAVCGEKSSPDNQGRVTGLLAKRGFRSSMVYKY
mmetsp:Transcript_71369/g.201298  ORF Transcript_71369/g.201298 Transcript_71369/m.201298 type:complete len:304 (-) Transcript_71369:3750-4661(-)|eukprot:CAMPEP_0119480380 /NCGR_PEP_ID=MMETSP1344-20130328/9210_1 /TAXON_ID=236787 /ORGANISM="Florenciella parvula, Strain CCMP2471" /LENGTH=303 /DNA_ID=CAMNT_0007514681 /DNA_START=77 /DNA_END=988 /DNA_ORIENTATION=-